MDLEGEKWLLAILFNRLPRLDECAWLSWSPLLSVAPYHVDRLLTRRRMLGMVAETMDEASCISVHTRYAASDREKSTVNPELCQVKILIAASTITLSLVRIVLTCFDIHSGTHGKRKQKATITAILVDIAA